MKAGGKYKRKYENKIENQSVIIITKIFYSHTFPWGLGGGVDQAWCVFLFYPFV